MSASEEVDIAVVGGVYREVCISPNCDQIYGSAGRAALALTMLGCKVRLSSYFDAHTLDVFAQHAAWDERLLLVPMRIEHAGRFVYRHWLARPEIFLPSAVAERIEVKAKHVLRFGTLESEPVVHADRAVFDPQNTSAPQRFRENGSSARELALVLNESQARTIAGDGDASELARRLINDGEAQVVVVKRGPLGALVAQGSEQWTVPAFWTDAVWKIGSGDFFAARFAYEWLVREQSPKAAAERASLATAFYCANRGELTPSAPIDEGATLKPIRPSSRATSGHIPTVYIAGPFFTLAQRWLVDEARAQFRSMRLQVFSPIHDVGEEGPSQDLATRDLRGIDDADVVFAIADGFDPGTVFEVGYARAHGKPVVVYAENERERHFTMFDGSGCHRTSDFVSAVYATVWSGLEQ